MSKIITQEEMKLKFIQDITDGVLESTTVMRSELHERAYIATLELVRKICYSEDVIPLLGICQKSWLGKNGIIVVPIVNATHTGEVSVDG